MQNVWMCPFEATVYCGINRLKFVTVALNSLGNHPSRTLRDHQNSNNHKNAVKAYNGYFFFSLYFLFKKDIRSIDLVKHFT